MALIKCENCGQMVSDKAKFCIHCGSPLHDTADEPFVENPNSTKSSWKWLLLIPVLAILAGGGYYAYAKYLKNTTATNEETKEEIDPAKAIVELTPEFIVAVQKYDWLGAFSEGLAAVSRDGKCGYINTRGEEVIPCQFAKPTPFDNQMDYYAGVFSEGLAVIINSDSKFSVIDSTGTKIFSGTWNDDTRYESGIVPKFLGGKLYMPNRKEQGYTIYDRQGNVVGKFSIEDENSPYEEAKKAAQKNTVQRYVTFTENYMTDENNEYSLIGVKDSKGNVVVPAIYDYVDVYIDDNLDMYSGTAAVSNGVVLVMLKETSEKGYHYDKQHYGYADLKGHDTFTQELKQRCKSSIDEAMAKIAEQEQKLEMEAQNADPDWLQGAWRIEMRDNDGYIYSVFNHGQVTTYASERIVLEDNYTIDGDVIQFGHGHYTIDRDRQIVITANGKEMEHVSNNPNYVPQFSSSNSFDGGSSRSSGYEFNTAYDVMGYLASNTFYDDENNSVRIRENGMYINGTCVTGAPQVLSFNSYNAVVQAHTIPSGFITVYVNSRSGVIKTGAGEIFRLR